jgi:hypothetical protein
MSEREQFEEWYSGRYGEMDFSLYSNGRYKDRPIDCMWQAWQARATIAQPVPEVPKDAAKEAIATGAKHSRYFSVVFKSNGLTQAEVEAFTAHPAFSAGSWSNLMHERNDAIAAQPVPTLTNFCPPLRQA